MTGAAAMIAATTGVAAAASGATFSPAPVYWNDIYAEDAGATQIVAITGTTAPIQVTASKTGGAQLNYILNGAYVGYGGPFVVHPNDTLGWSMISTSIADQSGVVTITNITTATTLASFSYTVYSSRGSRL